MLPGEDPALEALRTQYDPGWVARVEAAGLINAAGCALFASGGYLAFLECYTYGDVWAENAEVLSVRDAESLLPPKPTA